MSHPNILAIFDFGSEWGTAYAVTELLDDETLHEKLGGQHALASRKAVNYAVQIARGLAAAFGVPFEWAGMVMLSWPRRRC